MVIRHNGLMVCSQRTNHRIHRANQLGVFRLLHSAGLDGPTVRF